MKNVYKENKILDNIYKEKYEKNEPFLYEKNVIELSVEFSEFLNSSKVFKYWTIKKPNMDEVYEEAADTLLMIFSFFNYYDIKDIKEIEIKEDKLLYLINDLNKEITLLINKGSEQVVIRMYSLFMKIIRSMGMNEKELIKYSLMKIEKNKDRLNSDY